MLDKKKMRSKGNKIPVAITAAIILILELSLIPTSPIVLGENFGSNVRVDDTGFDITNQTRPDIAIFGDNIYVVWMDNRLSGIHNTNIYFGKSTDKGVSFGADNRVDNAPIGAAACPSIAVDKSNGNIYVVWQDYRNSPEPYSIDIYFANSTDGGNSFGVNKRVIDETGSNYQFVPNIAASNDFIGVVWEDERGGIYFANSTDRGDTFGESKRVSDILGTAVYYPKIEIGINGTIYVVWEHKIDDIYKILFSKSNDGGNTWTPSIKVCEDLTSEGQRMPSISLDTNDNIYVVWRDTHDKDPDIFSDMDIYFSKSTNGGNNFTTGKQISIDTFDEDQYHPSISVNNEGKIFVTWIEDKDFPNQENVSDIYFANSTDGGNNFSTKQKINDCPSFSAVYTPSNAIAVNGSHIYIVWQDDRNGNWDIYLSRSNSLPPMSMPISPLNDATLTNNTPTLVVTSVTDLDNDTVYYNFTISDQPDAESGTVYYSGWITSTSWKPPPLPNGIWYWHTYTSDMWNTTSPNWTWNFTINSTLGSYDIQLYEGWNLISIPFIHINTDLSSVLDSINDSYDAVQWYDAVDDSSSHWEHYHTSKPSDLNDLKSIDHTMGFWIHITEPGGVLFQCSGIEPIENQSVTLYSGWNLVGYPSLNNNSVSTALNNLTLGDDVDAIWAYNASTQNWEELGESDSFERGRGYWLYLKEQKTWEVPL
ncbi:MAG: hypothetical protein JSV09_12055 [Thermoplasmata archaeon]|nr:MAG: hypothetical protein JSV09_12055 [Thermoplasmata archaeon]